MDGTWNENYGREEYPMNGILKTVLIVLGILLLIPVVGFVVRSIVGLLMGVVGVVFGILALPFTLVGSLIGLIIGLLFLGLPLLVLVGVVFLGVWAASHAFGRRSEKCRRNAGTDMDTMRDIHAGLDKMEDRLASLETLLSDR